MPPAVGHPHAPGPDTGIGQRDRGPLAIGPPWHSSVQWREINAAFQYLGRRHDDRLDRCRRLANRLALQLTALFPLMDDLCRTTCPDCRAPCCQTALVWFDFKDLLFLHLAGLQPPVSQPLYPNRRFCRFLSSRGCRLPRLSRPWLCTWYLCPPQTAMLRSRRICLDDEKARIKSLRRDMENEFISVVG
jgi:hypothetical protein